MCDHENRETAMIVVKRDDNDKPTVWCDPCIAPLIEALYAGGIPTAASCCGHNGKGSDGEQTCAPGWVMLADGRTLLVYADHDAARQDPAAPWNTPAEPDAGDVETVADLLCEAAHPTLRRESCIADQQAVSCPDCRSQAEAVLASGWLAARVATAVEAEREQIVQAIRAMSSPHAGDPFKVRDDAARIARGEGA